VLTQPLRHSGRIHTAVLFQQLHQHRLDTRLALTCRQVQNPQVLLVRTRRLTHAQLVVGHAEVATGKHLLAVAIVGERPGLAHQPVDHVPVIDAMLATAAQPRHLLHLLLGVPHLHMLGVQPRLHLLADQPARHRVDVALHLDDAPPFHAHSQPLACLQTLTRQRPQQRHFLRQPTDAAGVLLSEHLPHETPVAVPAAEIPTAAHHQRLVQRPLELMVTLLRVAVLVALARLDGLPLQSVVTQQRLITPLERLRPFDARLHRRRQPIRPMQRRHASQFPQRVLQPLAQTLQAFRETDRSRFPVGVRQHEMIHHVLETTAVDGHAQVRTVREVAGSQATGMMYLSEEHLLGRTLLGTPTLDAPLQGPQLPVGETLRETTLQVREKGLRLQSGVDLKFRFEFGPELDEGVWVRPPVPVHAYDLAGQLAEPAILACRLGIHADAESSHLFGHPVPVELTKLPYLLIGDHREPPSRRALDDVHLLANREF
jgi:hypothetical protein